VELRGRDETERRLAAAERQARAATADLERAEIRSRLLAEASSLLTAALDFDTALRSLARLSVARIADWCLIYLQDRGDGISRVEMAHADPRKEHVAREMRLYPFDSRQPSPVLEVLETGQPRLIERIGDDFLEARRARDADHARLLQDIGASSAIIVPMVARGQMLGAIAFLRAASGRSYDDQDLALAEELGRRAALALDNASLYHEAQEAARAKSDFLAVISHELRTPLNAIMGYTDLLLMGVPEPLPESAERYARRIGASSRHLLHLVEEILAFSRMQAGETELRLEPVSLPDVLRQAEAEIRPLAEAKQLEFRREIPDALTLETDAAKLRQLLTNLLINAVKFTSAGHVGLRARGGHDEVVIEVEDTGVGIEAAHLERIFEPFWQAEAASTRRVGGTGLGLTIARRFALLLGGELTGESEPGRGSCFRVRIPLRAPGRHGQRAAGSAAGEAAGSPGD
jgi:signal transduction histidine kinase